MDLWHLMKMKIFQNCLQTILLWWRGKSCVFVKLSEETLRSLWTMMLPQIKLHRTVQNPVSYKLIFLILKSKPLTAPSIVKSTVSKYASNTFLCLCSLTIHVLFHFWFKHFFLWCPALWLLWNIFQWLALQKFDRLKIARQRRVASSFFLFIQRNCWTFVYVFWVFVFYKKLDKRHLKFDATETFCRKAVIDQINFWVKRACSILV